MDLLTGLNPQQQEAVMAGDGPVLVMAGPGSGKTRVLTHRIAYLIGSLGISPYHLLAVTFTNKAAREMNSRVEAILGGYTRGLTLGTFHAICARLLRREAEHLPFSSNFVIFDSDDQLTLVKQAIEDLNLDEKRNRPTGLHAAISSAKNELVLPEAFPSSNYREEVAKRVYKRYQELLLANNALDFDDLLLWTAFLLEENPAVRDKYARRYEHVLVDEFQDTNMAQYVLLKHLASHHHNIFAVGDADQSIYRWRGADYRNVQRFEQDFPDARIILLEQNYRSTQAILDVAMAVIDRNPQRIPKRLFTERGQGHRVLVHEVEDDRVEAAYVVDTIATQVARKSAAPGDFAIMYRTNAQSRLLEEAFLTAGLPYKLVGAQRFYGRREIKDLIAFLRLLHNPNDEVSLTRIINVPPRGIGDKTLLALRTQAQKVNLAPGALLAELGKDNASPHWEAFSGRAGAALHSFATLLAKWIEEKDSLAPLALLDRVIDDSDYHNYIDDGSEEGHDRWDNVMELRRVASEYQEQNLEAFLEQVALVSDQDTLEGNANAPTLLTLHAAKGLEFPVVMIVGLNDGTLPHSRSLEEPEEMMEERRLFYVGITRARDRLYLIYSQNRSAYGYAEPVDPSRFLGDIPGELVEETHPQRQGRQGSRWGGYERDRSQYGRGRSSYGQGSQGEGQSSVPYRPDRWEGPSTGKPATRQPPSSRYAPGMRVMHPTWGEGMVLNSRLQDDDEIVDIFFENVGLKRVAASLAKLEIKL